MDRNLGAMGADWNGHGAANTGKGNVMYQFGRNTPVPPFSSNTGATASGAVNNLVAMVANPDKYFNNSNYRNSAGIIANNYSWNDKNCPIATNKKSFFDPSPLGWQVPLNGTWGAMNTSNSPWVGTGRTYLSSSVGAYYPATGFTNTLYPVYVGVNAYSVSSTDFHNYMVAPTMNTSYANNSNVGLPVRPIQE